MECPHCKYKYEFDHEKKYYTGEHGAFYESPIKVEREGERYYGPDQVGVFACPACKILFIDN